MLESIKRMWNLFVALSLFAAVLGLCGTVLALVGGV